MATLRHHFRITLAAPLLALAVSGNVYSDEQIEFVRIPGGCFQMGSQKGERHELPLRKICVDSFEIGKFEVTQAQWKADMGTNPSHYSTCGDNCPVEQVSWNDAQEFVRRLNAKAQGVFRLPTEAE